MHCIVASRGENYFATVFCSVPLEVAWSGMKLHGMEWLE